MTVGVAVAAGGRAVAVPVAGAAAGAAAAPWTVTVAAVGSMPMTVSGAMAVGRLGGRRRRLLRRGHRPIIARTSDAHCSPRHICR